VIIIIIIVVVTYSKDGVIYIIVEGNGNNNWRINGSILMDKNYLYLRCNYDDDDNDVGDYNDKDRDDLPIEKQMLKYSFFYD